MVTARGGFTLIEVMLVILIMALLSIMVLPKIINLVTPAKEASRDHIIASVRSGVSLQKINSINEATPTGANPSTLDGHGGPYPVTCDTSISPKCFDGVIDSGVTDGRWQKTSDKKYVFDPNGLNQEYRYNVENGTFLYWP